MNWLSKSLSESIPDGEVWALYVGNSSLDFGGELPSVVIVRTIEGLKRLTSSDVSQVICVVSPGLGALKEIDRIRFGSRNSVDNLETTLCGVEIKKALRMISPVKVKDSDVRLIRKLMEDNKNNFKLELE